MDISTQILIVTQRSRFGYNDLFILLLRANTKLGVVFFAHVLFRQRQEW